MALDVARALKDPEYRKTLTAEDLAVLSRDPAAASELSEAELAALSGGTAPPPGWGWRGGGHTP
jgi:mersacidin/lichenicidin family type 2 lantibiotic